MPEGIGGTGWRGAKGENQDNYNSLINKIQLIKNYLKSEAWGKRRRQWRKKKEKILGTRKKMRTKKKRKKGGRFHDF